MKNYGAKIFKDKNKLNQLLELAETNKYSVPKLTKIFNCGKTTIFGLFSNRKVHVLNLGRFKKKYKYDEDFFIRLNAISAYWTGFIAADGCLWSKNGKDKSLHIGLRQSDIKHLKKFKRAIKTDAKIHYVESNNSVIISIRSEKIFDSLTKLGIEQNKSLRIRKVKISSHLMSHFIRGVCDGDGYFGGNKITHVQFTVVGYKPFLEQIQEILIERCGVKKVKIYPASYGIETKASKLQYTGSQIFKILDFLYKNSTEETQLDRKYKKYLALKDQFQRI